MAGHGGTENYYDILKVRSDCSDKEIRSAYVELSKKFHPDVKGAKADAQQTERFLKIAEAYQTLSKPKLRNEYNLRLQSAQSRTVHEANGSTDSEIYRPWEIKPNYGPNPGPYYGIKGLRKVTNSKVALILTALGIFTGVFGVFAVRESFSLNQKRLDDISAKANEHHQKIRLDVESNNKDEQLKRFIDRITNQAQR